MTAFVSVEGLGKHFTTPDGQGRWCVFRDLHLQMQKGEFVTVIGHSGCGKTTLLNIIAGLDEADEGGVLLDSREVAGPGLDRMVVFQSFALMPWMTVFDNIRLAVRAAHRDWPKARVAGHVQRFIEMVGLKGAEAKRPAQLSGGMRQRVGLARAFAIEPKMLLLDEPFAQIDALTRGVIQEELVRMWSTMRNTVFMVTHDVDEAILLSDKIMLMTNSPEARIAEIVEVTIPRPRARTTIIEHPLYYRIRNHIIRFLVEGPGAHAPGAGAAVLDRRPRVVRIEEPVAAVE
jgi:nitrate/nitrite transport system ATP-binding protein